MSYLPSTGLTVLLCSPYKFLFFFEKKKQTKNFSPEGGKYGGGRGGRTTPS
jgi:hypothetical protein